ncbi:hypothetical protein O6H91_15G035100 [Diphasiastrum complanatum]|uniref:Uncharacterized protein n=1 Tax=Diphasiastrum complanatum TaxID=34168 RepID=A0ACC2BHB2_DIPCM|nr:hypothetical protein O6H91_15G035100 [Diphasiastrum complanatum]
MVAWLSESESVSGSTHEEKVVCVIGTWGLVGGWIVKRLLERGYVVRTTIRVTPDEASALMACPGAAQRLKLMHADLLDYYSLSKVINGCVGVFYTSAPHDLKGIRNYPVDMIEFEVRGTLNVVEACANSESAHRLVLTSCLSTIVFTGQRRKDIIFDESSWTDLDFCKDKKLWSPLSKTLAERAAWGLARDKGLDLVVINPATVVGPDCSNPPHDQELADLLRKGLIAYALAEDVAEAHILAFENPQSAGRYICFGKLESGSNGVVRSSTDPLFISRLNEPFCSSQLSNQKLLKLGMKFGHL